MFLPCLDSEFRAFLMKIRLLILTLATIGVVSAAPPGDSAKLPPAATHKVDFVKDVQPLLATHCYSCHGPEKQKGNFRLDQKKTVLESGHIVPGKSSISVLIHLVAGLDPENVMPPKGSKSGQLTAKQIGILRAWIDQGANWPDSADTTVSKTHWAYTPLKKPDVPAVKNKDWVKNSVDAFILAKLETNKMTPTAPADKRTLLRRVSYDLTGLPPPPDEMKVFLEDKREDAYERAVDKLLASPRYGERWARHWMDVVHFAETHGHDQDAPRENAWPYRDYLINAFNNDKPYGRFVEEQIAGDILYWQDPQAVAATGFLAAGPWDESSLKDIQPDTFDNKIAQYLDRDDMITATMSTFAASTVHCARCHDHKFDPISQNEYYSLQAVFAGIDKANRPYDPDPKVAKKRVELLLKRWEVVNKTDNLLTAKVQEQVAEWEKTSRAREQWTILKDLKVTAAEGTTTKALDDDSVLFGGKRPEKDTYTIKVRSPLKKVTGIRLEVIPDKNLPMNGPGRQDNGNLHLTEIRLQATPAKGGDPRDVVLQNPSADYNQPGWEINYALDRKDNTAWGIHPQIGVAHVALFECKETIAIDDDFDLTFALDQQHGGGHLIGRLRLSVIDAAPPLKPQLIPPHIAQITALAVDKRTDQQKIALAQHALLEPIDRELLSLPQMQLVYAAAPDFTPVGNFKPARGCRPVHILKRGSIRDPGAVATPGALSCVSELPAQFKLKDANNEGERRALLAKWLSDPKNVLTWRSIANRVWHYHFGRGIVATPNDFGRMGAKPTHPELLDWLAVWLQENDGSLKKLHKLLVTSNTYRQASTHREEYAKTDSDNLLLWRMNRNRLDAECVRDAVLQASGKIDLTTGGPSVKQFIQKPGIHVTPLVDYDNFDPDSSVMYRRSVYRFVFRTLPDPFMDTLDCADPSQLTPVRYNSVTALHALAMLNDKFLVKQSEHFASRLAKISDDPKEQIKAAYEIALSRPATDKEVELLSAHAKKHGLANVCRLIFNLNEFMFIP